jgi:NitT/TauT family transport system permease protein
MNQKVFRIKNILLQASGLLFLLMLWEMAPRFGWVPSQYLPRFSNVIWTIYQQWLAGFLWVHIVVSLWRAVTGLLIAMIIAIPLGLVLGHYSKSWLESFKPLFRILSQANPFSLMPVFILFFGIGEAAKLAVITWVCLWPVLFNTIIGVQNIDMQLIKAARTLGLKPLDLLIAVLLPATAPFIFIGIRIGVEMAFFMLIAGEMIGAVAGLGWLLHNSAHLFQISRMYAAATCIVLLGVFLNRSLLWLENHLFFWHGNEPGFDGRLQTKPKRRLGQWELVLISLLIIGITLLGGRLVGEVNLKGGFGELHSHHQNNQPPVQDFGSSEGL